MLKTPFEPFLNIQALDVMMFWPPTPLRVVEWRILARGGISITGFSGFSARIAQNGAESAVWIFYRFLEKIAKLMYPNSTKIAF